MDRECGRQSPNPMPPLHVFREEQNGVEPPTPRVKQGERRTARRPREVTDKESAKKTIARIAQQQRDTCHMCSKKKSAREQ